MAPMVQLNSRDNPIKRARSRSRRLTSLSHWLGADRVRFDFRAKKCVPKRTRRSQNDATRSSRNGQRIYSVHRWDLWSPNMIAVLAIVSTVMFALIFGISSWYYQSRGDGRADADSRATAEGNRLAAENNRLAMWQLCKSEEELKNTSTCIELMKSGPFSPGKRDVSRKVSGQDFMPPEGLECFTLYHELFMHLWTQRSELDRKLRALHNLAEQPTCLKDSSSSQIHEQYRHIVDSVLASEYNILALLCLLSWVKGAEEHPTLVAREESQCKIVFSPSVKFQFDPESNKSHQPQTRIELEDPTLPIADNLEAWTDLLYHRVDINLNSLFIPIYLAVISLCWAIYKSFVCRSVDRPFSQEKPLAVR